MEALSKESVPSSIAFRLLCRNFNPLEHAEFADLVERGLDWCARQLAANPQLHVEKSEDALTEALLVPLQAMGLNASATRVGGNCDVHVQGPGDLRWLGEAKIWNGAAYVYEGYLQLTTRYATGARGQSRGGMLIYCLEGSTGAHMPSWQTHLTEQVPGIRIEACAREADAFFSMAEGIRTSEPLTVRHLPISLVHNPRDKSARQRKKSSPKSYPSADRPVSG